MIRKIVFLTEQPLDERNFERFGIEFFLKQNFKIEYWVWGLSHLDFPSIEKKNIKVVYLNNDNDIGVTLTKTENFFYVDLIDKNSVKSQIFRYKIKRVGGKQILIDVAKLPYSTISINKQILAFGLKKTINSLGIKNFVKKILFYVPKKIFFSTIKKIFNVKPFFHIVCGKLNRLDSEKKFGKNIQIRSHALDYEQFIVNSKKENNNYYNGKILFIDQGLPNHFETNFRNKANWISKDKYWSKINLFLEKIEKIHKKEILISLHPREELNSIWSKFQIIKGDTFRLIKDTDFAITHNSTCFYFSILLKKPFFFVSMNEMQNNASAFNIYKEQYILSSLLKKKIINIDNFEMSEISSELIVNNEIYETYKENWIKENSSPNISLWENLINKIENV